MEGADDKLTVEGARKVLTKQEEQLLKTREMIQQQLAVLKVRSKGKKTQKQSCFSLSFVLHPGRRGYHTTAHSNALKSQASRGRHRKRNYYYVYIPFRTGS